jgi:hypothetical protein
MEQITVEKLAEEVRKMRRMQKDYFRTRSYAVLMESKAQEKFVDAMLEGILLDGTSKLF